MFSLSVNELLTDLRRHRLTMTGQVVGAGDWQNAIARLYSPHTLVLRGPGSSAFGGLAGSITQNFSVIEPDHFIRVKACREEFLNSTQFAA